MNSIFKLKKTLFLSGCLRIYSTSGPRVRFAPSPTGSMHVGGLRTALLNYLFAKSNGGQFVLRIEDTDRNRTVPGAFDDIKKCLEWTNLIPDEGPGYGGNYGPYIQSERGKLYHASVDDLLSKNKAYRCVCSADRLELLRKEQRKRKEKPGYDGKCRNLDPASIPSNTQSVVRFKLENRPSVITDLILGSITIDIGEVEGDPLVVGIKGLEWVDRLTREAAEVSCLFSKWKMQSKA